MCAARSASFVAVACVIMLAATGCGATSTKTVTVAPAVTSGTVTAPADTASTGSPSGVAPSTSAAEELSPHVEESIAPVIEKALTEGELAGEKCAFSNEELGAHTTYKVFECRIQIDFDPHGITYLQMRYKVSVSASGEFTAVEDRINGVPVEPPYVYGAPCPSQAHARAPCDFTGSVRK
jgi:hypothetical protein